ncbi:MAG: L,D-transpeptidase [Verrucomicrobiota bacterium]
MRIRFLLPLLFATLLTSCFRDRDHVIRVSIPEQRMALYTKNVEVARYDISTSKFGLGDVPGSNCTPLGKFEIKEKIGAGEPAGMKFKNRQPTGEIVPVNAPGRDPIVTRILWLRGLEDCNRCAFERTIYIHGTPEEWRIGTPSSYGCVRMRSRDVIELFDTVGRGARVFIETSPLPTPQLSSGNRLAQQEGTNAIPHAIPTNATY